MTYRSSMYETTGRSLASIIFGRKLRLPADQISGRLSDQQTLTSEDYVRQLIEDTFGGYT